MQTQEKRELVCIMCPVGCRLTVTQKADGELSISGNGCGRGIKYGKDEFSSPVRMVTSSVWVEGGVAPVTSVKTRMPVPKASIDAVLDTLKSVRATAPIAMGQVIIADAAGTGVDIIATRPIEAKA